MERVSGFLNKHLGHLGALGGALGCRVGKRIGFATELSYYPIYNERAHNLFEVSAGLVWNIQ